VLRIEPKNAFALHVSSVTKLLLKDYQGALQDLNEVLRIEPKNALLLVIVEQQNVC
jgi:hypothetical protein